jgi:hypothetical protein
MALSNNFQTPNTDQISAGCFSSRRQQMIIGTALCILNGNLYVIMNGF